MKIYNEVVIDMNTGETIYEDSFEYDGELALCGGDPGDDAEYAAATEKINASRALGPHLTSSFESMQKQFTAMQAVYDNQTTTANNRYTLAENAETRAQEAYAASVGEGYDPSDPDSLGGFIGRQWDTAQDQYDQAGRRRGEMTRQAGASVKAALRGSAEKSRLAGTKASTMARQQAAKSGLAGGASQDLDLSEIYRSSAMEQTAAGEGYKSAIYAAEDAYETAGYTRDAAELAKDKAVFGAGQTQAAAEDALTEAGYARDTALQNIQLNQAQLTGKMEQDMNSMLTAFYQATGVEYGKGVNRATSDGKFIWNWGVDTRHIEDLGYDEFDTDDITGG